MNKHAVLDHQRVEQHKVGIADEHTLPVTLTSDPFISHNLIITLNHCGSCHINFDMQPVEFHLHDIAVMLPDHIIGNGQCSADYRITVIVIARSFFDELVNREAFMGFLKYRNPITIISTKSNTAKLTLFLLHCD